MTAENHNTAYCRIRQGPLYRSEAFHSGLRACGFRVSVAEPKAPRPGDVLVIWNRYQWQDMAAATVFERAGATVLVAENAYIWKGGVSPHHLKVRPAYALARGWHNDASMVRMGAEDRWSALGVDLAPWRSNGGHILVCPNRPFGAPGRAMPQNWAREVAGRLRGFTSREIRLRPHPNNDPPAKPLAEDLKGAYVTVIWSSSAGVHSLIHGIPVICEAPYWICKPAAFSLYKPEFDLNDPVESEYPDGGRLEALQKMAHAQFSIDEIASGYAFQQVMA